MITFNPRTGEISDNGELVENDRILMKLGYTFKLEPGTESHFSLLSIKRMFNRYPDLQKVNGWAKDFMAYAEQVPLRVGMLQPADYEWGDNEIQHLMLQRSATASWMELTGRSNIDEELNTFHMTWEDTPCVNVDDFSTMCGVTKTGTVSLSLTALHEVFYMPIVIAMDEVKIHMTSANAERTRLDYSTVKVIKKENPPTITLDQVIYAILMDLSLDSEEYREEMKAMLSERVEEQKSSTETEKPVRPKLELLDQPKG